VTGKVYNHFLFKQIRAYLDAASSGAGEPEKNLQTRWVHYSAHDTDLANIWYALNISSF
jgi:hypothetical protein